MIRERFGTRRTAVAVGAAMWLGTIALTAASAYGVYARAVRATAPIILRVDGAHGLAPGDSVYARSENGLVRVGEVARVEPIGRVELAVTPGAARGYVASTRAVCWRTPLSVEDSIHALLPPAARVRIAEALREDWLLHKEEWAATWGPLAGELASAYIRAVGEDVAASVRVREDALWDVARRHGRVAAEAWPAIQQRLTPILQEHLTPVLSRLMNDALDEAPKTRIAWGVIRGHNADVFRHVLDWLADYLAHMPDKDKAELSLAVRRSWQAARSDPVLVEHIGALARNIRNDAALRDLIVDIYREAIVDNPRSRDFLRDQVRRSPRVREQMYRFIETIGPTARRVASICLFDERGRTRPEVVHWLRSAALRRHVAWVTLDRGDPDDPPLPAGAVLTAELRGGLR